MPVPYEGARFGQWVREHRKALDMTQHQLASQVGCSEGTLRKFEAGTRRPSRYMVERLTQFFGVSPAEERQVMQWARFGRRAAAKEAVKEQVELASDIDEGTAVTVAQVHLAPSNLPAPLTSLIGRERELVEASGYLRGKVRLLTLTGPPGVGKTRLAIAIAHQLRAHYSDGIYFVSVASVRDPELVLPTLARALGLSEGGQEEPLDVLKQALLRRVLLLLDNFEQVVEAAPGVVELLEACPHVGVLVTSREALRVRGEQQMVVPPLPLPDAKRAASAGELASNPSLALFVERARGVKPDFRLTDTNAAAVAELCARLDGLPLAIELAAAQTRVLSPQRMLERLGSRLALLSDSHRDLPPQHRTLRAAIEWSYDLLPPHEQALFAYLSVFAGGFGLQGAEAVAGSVMKRGEVAEEDVERHTPRPHTGGRAGEALSALRSLVDKSLLQRVESSEGILRFTMLETIREYAAERLETLGGNDDANTRHADYYLALVEEAERGLTGQEQAVWLERLEQEHQNLRAALEWTLVRGGRERAGEVAMGARIAGALVRFWDMRGHWSEGRTWLKAALTGNEGIQLPSAVLAKVSLGAGRLASFQDDRDEAHSYFVESLALYRQLGDKQGMTEALNGLALLAAMRSDRIAARRLLEESLSLSRGIGDLRGVAKTLSNLGQLTIEMGDLEQAEAMQTEALGVFRELGDKWGVAVALENMGQLAAERGNYERAMRLLNESRMLTEELGDKARLSWVLGDLGIVWLALGDFENAIKATGQALELFIEMGDRNGQGLAHYILGVANLYRAALEEAESYFMRSLFMCRQMGETAGCAPPMDGLAAVALRRGDLMRAARLLGMSSELRQGAGHRVEMVERPLYEHTADEVQRVLGGKVFRKAYEDARSLPMAQAIAYALGTA